MEAGGNITKGSETGCDVAIERFIPGTGFVSIAPNGSIWGINGNKGWLHISSPGGIGTFVSTNQGYVNGDSITYTPTSSIASCEQLDALIVSNRVVELDQSVAPCN